MLFDVRQVLLHQQAAILVGVVHRGGGHRGGRQCVVALVGIEVAPHLPGLLCPFLVVHHLPGVVGGQDAEAFAARIDVVALPRLLAVIDVRDEESAARESGIATRLLAVLHDVVLVPVPLIIYNVGFGGFSQGFHVLYVLALAELLQCHPSAEGTLVCGVACGLVTIVQVVAHVHEVPHISAVVEGSGSEGTLVVHVRQTEAVAELVADGAYAVQPFSLTQFTAAREVVYRHPVHLEGLLVRTEGIEGALLRPDEPRVLAVHVLSLSGIEDEDLVHRAVPVPVVLGEIDVVVGPVAGIIDELSQVGVEHRAVVLSVVVVGVGQAVGSHHVEVELKLSVALCQEVVMDTSLEPHFGVGEVHLVGHTVVVGSRIGVGEGLGRRVGTCTLVELHQDDESPLLARELVRPGAACGCRPCAAHLVGSAACLSACLLYLAAVSPAVASSGLVYVGLSLAVCPVGTKFIALELGTHLSAVREPQGAPLAGQGGYGTNGYSPCVEQGCTKNLVDVHGVQRITFLTVPSV